MPSPKGYIREDVLDRAIELFRQNGYSATSTAELVETLGMNRKSMYAEFGSKQKLFEAALERYNAVNLSRVLAPIEAPDANAQTIIDAFKGYASASETKFRGSRAGRSLSARCPQPVATGKSKRNQRGCDCQRRRLRHRLGRRF